MATKGRTFPPDLPKAGQGRHFPFFPYAVPPLRGRFGFLSTVSRITQLALHTSDTHPQ